jgi:hypothetical protein
VDELGADGRWLVRQCGDEAGDGEHLRRGVGIGLCARAGPAPAAWRAAFLRHGHRIGRLDAGGERFQQDATLVVVLVERPRRPAENLDRVPRKLQTAEREAEDDRRVDACCVVEGRPHGLLQVRTPARLRRHRLGDAEVEEDRGPVRGFGRLRERPPKVDGGVLRSALAPGQPGRLDQAVDGPEIAGRVGGEQVLGDAGVHAGNVREQARRRAVLACPLRSRQRFVDAAAHDRMDEDERLPRIQDPGRDERLGRRLRFGVREPG